MLTAPGSWQFVVFLLAALAIAAVAIERRATRGVMLAGAAAAAVAVMLVINDGPTAVWRHGGIGVGRASLPENGGPNALKARVRTPAPFWKE